MVSPFPLSSGSLLNDELEIDVAPENWLNFCFI